MQTYHSSFTPKFAVLRLLAIVGGLIFLWLSLPTWVHANEITHFLVLAGSLALGLLSLHSTLRAASLSLRAWVVALSRVVKRV